MSKSAVIFGTGGFAEVAHFYLEKDSEYQVVGFTASAANVTEPTFRGVPLEPFEEVEQRFDPSSHEMFVAVGYARLNRVREEFCKNAKAKGYRLLSYVCSRATHWGDTKIGENVFIFEENTLQPFVEIGSGTILWSGNHIGHHTSIGSHCFITSHVVVSGYCRIGDHCFVGVNATIADGIRIGDRNIIGPGALIQKDTGSDEVYVAERTKKFPKDSSRFFK
jgi:sugar O-acyltransferase (sialic acid O-acetyltransferase NeuD family)